MENKKIVFEGKLIKCNRTAKSYKGVKGKEKLYISLADVVLSDEQKAIVEEAFKDSGKKFTPTWVSDFEGYVNLATIYELPCKVDGVEYDSIEDFISDNESYGWLRADVKMSCNVKSGVIYPKALLFVNEGEVPNAFDDFDE